ncbi:hypothetical protein [Bosea sp. TAB14]|uniref:hypothetical protein n=1 Tax=Bosea sp. TAB14 TaxID=3237481 RepID=UPI003F929A2A
MAESTKLRNMGRLLALGLAGITVEAAQASDREGLHAQAPAAVDLSTMGGSAYEHNRSRVTIIPESGLIAYFEPKAALRDVARAGTVIFRGKPFRHSGRIEGTAYAFKRGRPPAPYAVSGGYSADNTAIVLRGAAPIRQGCEVTGYSARSPHAVLRFKSLMS